VAELAMRHREVSTYPLLDQIEGRVFAELFRNDRVTGASNSELTAMGKLILDKKRMVIELASGDNAAEKPKIEIRVTPGDDNQGGAAQFTPKQRERLRRALGATLQAAAVQSFRRVACTIVGGCVVQRPGNR
jgi:hypothetical protein